MKSETDEQRRIVGYLDGLPPSLRFGDLRQAKVNALRELKSALMPSILDKAFKGEL